MAKSKKHKNKAKLNLTVREEQRNKLEQIASNLIEVMADERWKRLAEEQGIAYAKAVAEAMNLNWTWTIQQTARNCAGRFSILSPVEKRESKNGLVEILSFSFCQAFCSAIHLPLVSVQRGQIFENFVPQIPYW
jgi:hypothetical protein